VERYFPTEHHNVNRLPEVSLSETELLPEARMDLGDSDQITFTDTDKSSILGFRPYETNPPRFRRSGKKAGSVCVFGGGDFAVDAGVGFGVAGCGNGLLRWGDVPAAWACAEENFGRCPARKGCADGRLRASWAEGGDGLQHGLLPSHGSGCDRGGCFCGAQRCSDFRAPLQRLPHPWPSFLDELPGF